MSRKILLSCSFAEDHKKILEEIKDQPLSPGKDGSLEKIELCKALEEMEMRLKLSQDEVLELATENKSLNSEREELQTKIINLGDDISVINDEFGAHKLRCESNLIAIEQELKNSQSSVEKYRESNEKLDGQRILLENDLLTMRKEKVELCKALEERERRLKTSQNAVLELATENKNLNSEREDFQTKIIHLVDEISIIKQSNGHLESKLLEAVKEKEEIKEELKISESSVEKYRESNESLDSQRIHLENDLLAMRKEKNELCKALDEMEKRLKTSQDEVLELATKNKSLNSEREEFQTKIIHLGDEISVIRKEFEAQRLRRESNLVAIEEVKANLSKSLASAELDRDEKVKEARNYYSNKFESFKSKFLEEASSKKAEFEARIQDKDKEISDLKAQAVNASILQDQVESKLLEAVKEKEEIKKELKTNQDEVLELVAENKNLNSENDEFLKQIINLGDEISIIKESNGNFENQLLEAVNEKEEIKEQLKNSQLSVEKYQESNERLDSQRLLLETELLTMQKEKIELCKALEERERRLKTSQDELQELQSQNKSPEMTTPTQVPNNSFLPGPQHQGHNNGGYRGSITPVQTPDDFPGSLGPPPGLDQFQNSPGHNSQSRGLGFDGFGRRERSGDVFFRDFDRTPGSGPHHGRERSASQPTFQLSSLTIGPQNRANESSPSMANPFRTGSLSGPPQPHPIANGIKSGLNGGNGDNSPSISVSSLSAASSTSSLQAAVENGGMVGGSNHGEDYEYRMQLEQAMKLSMLDHSDAQAFSHVLNNTGSSGSNGHDHFGLSGSTSASTNHSAGASSLSLFSHHNVEDLQSHFPKKSQNIRMTESFGAQSGVYPAPKDAEILLQEQNDYILAIKLSKNLDPPSPKSKEIGRVPVPNSEHAEEIVGLQEPEEAAGPAERLTKEEREKLQNVAFKEFRDTEFMTVANIIKKYPKLSKTTFRTYCEKRGLNPSTKTPLPQMDPYIE